jgi:dATP pyrophosphohydrolase
MPAFAQTHVEVYVFRRRRGRAEFLVLRRAPGRRVLPGVWQPVTGKRDARERTVAAAVRELREETGLEPRRLWCLESVTTYFDATRDRLVVLPLFAAEVPANRRVALSAEHDACAWLPAAAAARRFLWESQRRGIAAVTCEVLRRRDLAAALLVPVPGRSTRRRGPRRARRR